MCYHESVTHKHRLAKRLRVKGSGWDVALKEVSKI